MRRIKVMASFLLLLTLGSCGSEQKQDEVITVDMTESYLEKTLKVQDFLDVEYIPLETNDDFVTQGEIMAVGKEYILVKNFHADGNIFFFDRKTGKAVKKINRMGQSSEEYTHINTIILDEARQEIYVNSSPAKTIYVYDLDGNFKRRFAHAEGAEYLRMADYDSENLIAYDMTSYFEKEGEKPKKPFYHVLLSKQDGHVTKEFPLPIHTMRTPFLQKDKNVVVMPINSITPMKEGWLLMDTSVDTVYQYIPEANQLKPFVAKKPSSDLPVFLTVGVVTDRYYFIQGIEKDFDFATGRGFHRTSLVYDAVEKTVSQVEVINGDYPDSFVNVYTQFMDREVVAYQVLQADVLVDAYQNNKLQGKLKDLASRLDEEDNPVVMLMKWKK